MAISRKDSVQLFASDATNTLRLIGYLLLAIALMVADHHNGYLHLLRWGLNQAVEPMYRLAALPSNIIHQASRGLADRNRLAEENATLRRQLLLAEASLDRVNMLRSQNRHLRQLLDVQRSLGLGVQLARIVDVDTDPSRQRVIVDAGANQQVHVGQAVLDAQGVMGQVVEVLPNMSTVMLITDPSHALPIVLERTGMRAIARGRGRDDMLELSNVPLSADVRVGDRLMTSGLGGHFPAGFPVGVVRKIGAGPDGIFAIVEATPSAALNRSIEVLIVHRIPDPVGPPATVKPIGPPVSLAPRPTSPAGKGGSAP